MSHPTHDDCIFCKIVAGTIACHKIFEGDGILVMLDIGPLSRGHVLVIPKGHYETLATVPDAVAGACGALLPRLVRALHAVTGTSASNVLQNNGRAAHQAVDHVHFHVIPKPAEGGLGLTWPAGNLDAGDATDLVGQIAGHMG